MTAACRICDSPRLRIIERRDGVPILMNRLYPTRDAARAAARGRLEFAACDDCGFASNLAFDPALIVYDEEYENDQAFSPAFAAHVEQRARDVAAAVPDGTPIDFLEIGSGQGRFIEAVSRAAGRRLRSAEGFDPAWRGADGEGPAGARIHKCYFDAESATGLAFQPNVVVSRHTIEHVPDPLSFLRSIRTALGPLSRAAIFIETPCIDWIRERRAVQDYFYEHCSIFTADALALALERAGFACTSVEKVFGGQYLWARGAAVSELPRAHRIERPADFDTALASAFAGDWRTRLAHARGEGPVAIWGAGAKGVTFASIVDPDGGLLDHAIDVNPQKQGRFLAASGLPVLSPEASAKRGPRTVVVMNPNYRDEISDLARKSGIAATFLILDETSP